jgi:2-polyprenyl-6-methoxyphenol hydroxylase-like FAD-dependent oxidoreductase
MIGGGLAGLAAALDLAGRGYRVAVVERKQYPFHKVCGEYVSNEVLPYLRRLHADPAALAPAAITKFLLSSPGGRILTAPLDLGGFGVSRYALDDFLYQLAVARGVTFYLKSTVTDVAFDPAADRHRVTLADGRALTARVVLGTYGKRANLDRQLQRPFFSRRSPYLGVKYHLRLPGFPRDVIALHNFADGYAGISAIEADKLCFCYLTTRQNLRQHGTIAGMEREVLARNPRLREILGSAERLYPQPEVINEISFAPQAARGAARADVRRRGRPHHAPVRQRHGHGAARRGPGRGGGPRFFGEPHLAGGHGNGVFPGLARAVWGAPTGGAGGATAVWRPRTE